MREKLQLKYTPKEAKSCFSGKRLAQALAYLIAVVEEQGGIAELTILIQRPKKCRIKKECKPNATKGS